jgi:hypothetical protein
MESMESHEACMSAFRQADRNKTDAMSGCIAR